MEMYSDYCESKVPPKTSQQRHMSKQQIPPSAFQIQQTPHRETIPKDIFKRRKQINQPLEAEETILKEGMDKRSATIVSSTTLEKDTISSTLPSTTRPFTFSPTSVDITTEGIGRMPIAPDLVWPGHPDVQGTSLFPRDDDLTTISAGGLDPDERWKIHHPYDIPGVRRPTMDTPDNLR